MNPDQVLEIARTYGPSFLAAFGGLLSLMLSLMTLAGRLAWRAHNQRMASMAGALERLAKAVSQYQDKSQKDNSKAWEAVQGLRAELQLSTQKTDHIKACINRLEGALTMQVTRVDTYVERMGRVDSKLDRIFIYIDAPKRATDRGSHG